MASRLTALCFSALVLTSAPAAAQDDWNQPWSDPRDRPPRVDLSVSAGLLAPTDWSDLVILGSISPLSGTFEQVLVRDLRVDPGEVYGAAVTYWQDRYGFRAHAALSRSSLIAGATPLDINAPGEIRAAEIDSWFYDVRGAIGLVDYSPSRKAWPYVFIGFGGITYDLDRTITPPLLTLLERDRGRPRDRGDIVVVEDDGREFLLSVDELGLESVFALNFGVGADLRIPMGGAGIGLRLELSDHLARSPLGLRIRELDRAGGLTSDAAVRFGAVHHLRMAAGIVLQIGR